MNTSLLNTNIIKLQRNNTINYQIVTLISNNNKFEDFLIVIIVEIIKYLATML